MSMVSRRWISVVGFAGLVALAGCTSGTSSKSAALMANSNVAGLLPLTDAVAIGKAQVPDGTAVGVELELEDDDDANVGPAWEVSLFVSGSNQLIEVKIDARTGAVLEVEVEDDAADSD